eukprot:TRINITY_DN5455_c0_g1_i2.p1 TRINITY_DN5455_c0_g1~~TRINITY_DN5455_c0_g1_i2.p1  ORF type:complete len:478 (-),score=164.88 TRINITY_DN5455_c0_g1_i2:199-1602(-)
MFIQLLKARYGSELKEEELLKLFEGEVAEVFEQTRPTRGGKNASYIQELEKVDPELFAVSFRTIEGHSFSLGDHSVQFSMQSASKPLVYSMACEELGGEEVHRWVGCEPSGARFNAFTLNDANKPFNPFVNTGSILLCSLIERGVGNAERYDLCLKHMQKMAGGAKINFSNTIFLSERDTADRNKALAYFMSEQGAFPKGTDITSVLDFYFQCCSMEVDVKVMANIASTIANGGVSPITQERVLSPETVRSLLILLFSCGMYDYSGAWAFEVGLPAKSGVSGVIMVTIPNLLGFAIYSPPLDFRGNSVRGVEFCTRLNERFNFHLFSQLVNGSAIREPGHLPSRHHLTKKHDLDDNFKCIQSIRAASEGRLVDLQNYIINEGVSPNQADYDLRTPLHLASAEGHLDCVQFLVEKGASLNILDRWGFSPLDDAVRGKHTEVVNFIVKSGGYSNTNPEYLNPVFENSDS